MEMGKRGLKVGRKDDWSYREAKGHKESGPPPRSKRKREKEVITKKYRNLKLVSNSG